MVPLLCSKVLKCNLVITSEVLVFVLVFNHLYPLVSVKLGMTSGNKVNASEYIRRACDSCRTTYLMIIIPTSMGFCCAFVCTDFFFYHVVISFIRDDIQKQDINLLCYKIFFLCSFVLILSPLKITKTVEK